MKRGLPYPIAYLCALAVAAHAQEMTRTPVPDPRPLMLAAIDAQSGKAHGVLVGQVADAIRVRFQGTTPIFIDVTTQRRYAQPGCSRLTVTFWQDGVLLPDSPAPHRQTIEFGIDYCRDGTPPKSLS